MKHEGGFQQNAWPEFIHYTKYKNNEKTVIWTDMGRTYKTVDTRSQLDHLMVLMLEMIACLCVCVFLFVCMPTALFLKFIQSVYEFFRVCVLGSEQIQ